MRIALALALIVTTPALANDFVVPEHVLLWKNLYSGMSKTQVESLYPQKRIDMSPNCPVRLWPIFKSDRLVTVVLINEAKGPTKHEAYDCFQPVLESLKRELGPGDEKIKKRTGGSGLLPYSWTVKLQDISWRGSPRSVHYTTSGVSATYNLRYTVEPNPNFRL